MLDASIYQNQKPQSFADAMAPWVQMLQAKQSIEQSRAATANLQAQTPGIEADSKEKARIAARNQLAQDLAQQHTVVREDGTEELDMPSYKRALAKNGLVDEAFNISGTELNQKAQEIQNAYHAGMNPVLIAEGQKKLANDTFAEAANTLSQLPSDEARKEYAAKYVPIAVQKFGLDQNDPRIMILMKGKKDEILAIANTATPQERAQLAVSQGQLSLAQAEQGANFSKIGYTKEGRDPNSAVSRQAREMLRAKGVEVPDSASLYDMNRVPAYAEVLSTELQSNIVPTATRAEATKKVAEIEAGLKSYGQAINYAGSMKSKYGNGKVGDIRQKFGTRLMGDPEYGALMTHVQVHNQLNPGDQITNDDNLTFAQIEQKLKVGEKQLANKKFGEEKLAGSKSFPSGPIKTAPPAAIELLKKDPSTKQAFKQKYGYLPEGF